MSTTLAIGGKVFRTGDRAVTPEGAGEVKGLDPFADEEIGVRLDDGRFLWFSCRDVVVETPPPKEGA